MLVELYNQHSLCGPYIIICCLSASFSVWRIVELLFVFGRTICSLYGFMVFGQVEGSCTHIAGVIIAIMSDFGLFTKTQLQL